MFDYKELLKFYKGKRVFITGHTGFKGTWLSKVLTYAGAIVTGYALDAPTDPSLFKLSDVELLDNVTSVIGDIRDAKALSDAFNKARPEIVFHLAAQPLVIDSYKRPAYTYETNVMGTVNILECVRAQISEGYVKSFLNVTTDKVYYNDESGSAFTEDMPLDGYDPYSNSKSCSELVTHSYRDSFLKAEGVPVSTARAGNVIGGGDFAENRIVPDCVRAAAARQEIIIRNPYSVRPFQHVLEPLFAYLMIAKMQYEDISYAGAYNVGPDESDCVEAGKLATLFCNSWGEGLKWDCPGIDKNAFHEAGFLRLECAKLKDTFSWEPTWTIGDAIEKTVAFSKAWLNDASCVPEMMDKQIEEFINGI